MSSTYRYRPPHRLRPTLIAFLLFGLATDLFYAVESLVIGLYYPNYYNADAPYAPGEELLTNLGILVGLVAILGYLTTVILFCCWIYRANANARALGAQDMEIGPGWSVGWYFIPIANLFKPYQSTQEIYQASDPDRGAEEWRIAPKAELIKWWWAAWIFAGIVGQIDTRMGLSTDYRIAHLSSWTGIATGLLSVIAAILVIQVIRRIDARQMVKAIENPSAAQRHCLQCGYDLSGSFGRSTCPECGTPIPRSMADSLSMPTTKLD